MSKAIFHEKQNGEMWFLGIYSNNYEDRHAEIMSWAAHQDFAAWLKRTGAKPPITMLHQPQFPAAVHAALAVGLSAGKLTADEYNAYYAKMYKPYAVAQTEAVIPLKGFMLVVGKVLDHKKELARELSASGMQLGMSLGFIVGKMSDNIIEMYRAFEFSSLPVEMAANMLTVSSFKEDKMEDKLKELSEEHRELLNRALTADPDDLEGAFGDIQKVLNSLLNHKALDTEEQATEQEEVVVEDEVEIVEDYAELRGKIFADLNVEGLQATLVGLNAYVQKLEKRVDELEQAQQKSEDEIVAEQYDAIDWMKAFVPTEQAEADEPQLEELKKNALKSLGGKQESKNPLDFGFWGPLARQ